VSDAARFEYEGPLSVNYEEGVYGEIEMGDYGEPNRFGVHRFEGDGLADVVFDMIGGQREDDGWPNDRAVKRVRIVVEVLDAEEHKPPKPPELTEVPPGFEPPAPPEMT
jgi:hypothetical protein